MIFGDIFSGISWRESIYYIARWLSLFVLAVGCCRATRPQSFQSCTYAKCLKLGALSRVTSLLPTFLYWAARLHYWNLFTSVPAHLQMLMKYDKACLPIVWCFSFYWCSFLLNDPSFWWQFWPFALKKKKKRLSKAGLFRKMCHYLLKQYKWYLEMYRIIWIES